MLLAQKAYAGGSLALIHEGTRIQAVDLMERKTSMSSSAGLGSLESLRAIINRACAAGGEAAAIGHDLDDSLTRLVQVTRHLHAEPDPPVRLANASIYHEAAGHIMLAWVWLAQFLATGTGDDDLRQGKRQAARYFFRYELPRTRPQLELLEKLDPTTLQTQRRWHGAHSSHDAARRSPRPRTEYQPISSVLTQSGDGITVITINPPQARNALDQTVAEGIAAATGEFEARNDLTVAARDATFGLPEVKRGVVAAAGGLLRLPETVP